ncbi:MAG: type II toxin-antitoxin system HicB family antitoxin [Pirellulales bacterium]
MRYQVEIYPSDEGFAICVPSLPGCWSQGATQDEAVENISVAIREYLEAEDEPPNGSASAVRSGPGDSPALSEEAEVREVEITD